MVRLSVCLSVRPVLGTKERQSRSKRTRKDGWRGASHARKKLPIRPLVPLSLCLVRISLLFPNSSVHSVFGWSSATDLICSFVCPSVRTPAGPPLKSKAGVCSLGRAARKMEGCLGVSVVVLSVGRIIFCIVMSVWSVSSAVCLVCTFRRSFFADSFGLSFVRSLFDVLTDLYTHQ